MTYNGSVASQDDAQDPLIDLELECAILGTLLSDDRLTLWPQIAAQVKPEHFSEPVHSRIYEAAATITATGFSVSPLTLNPYLAADAPLQGLGGITYLGSLVANSLAPMQLKPAVELLLDLAVRRAAMTAADEMKAAAQIVTAGESFRPALADSIGTLQNLFDKGSTRRTTFSAGEAGQAVADQIKMILAGGVDPNVIKTGIDALDRQIGGFRRGDYVVLGARPSVGKSALATEIAANIAKRGQGVIYFSLEMSEQALMQRMISSHLWSPRGGTNVEYQRIARANVSAQEARWIGDVAEEFKHYPLFIEKKEALSPAELEARANVMKSRLAREYGCGLDLLVVDHIHLMHQPGARSEVEMYTAISGRLAEIAKRLNCPVLALAQLNRSLEAREVKRPRLSDLRASGSIEQDADIAMFAHRDACTLKDKCADPIKEMERLTTLHQVENLFEVLIEKQRNGPTGTVELFCSMANNAIRDTSEAMGLREVAA